MNNQLRNYLAAITIAVSIWAIPGDVISGEKSSGQRGTPQSVNGYPIHDGVPGYWLDGVKGFEKASEIHRKTGKPMMIYVYTEWCGYCRHFNTKVLPVLPVQQCLDNFTKVKLNAEQSPAARKLATELRISGYPTVVARGKDDLMLRPMRPIVSPAEFIVQCQDELNRSPG